MPIPIVSDVAKVGVDEVVAVIWCEELKQNVGVKIQISIEIVPSGKPSKVDPMAEGQVAEIQISDVSYHFYEEEGEVTDYHRGFMNLEKYQKEFEKIVSEVFVEPDVEGDND